MAANGRHDFQGVASAALASAELLLPEWLPGNKRGNEWVGLRKANGGPGDSWKVNLDTGVWAHFGADSNGSASRGGDLIDLYAALRHIDLGTACEQLAQQLGINDRGIPVLPTRMPMPTAAVSKPKPIEPKSDPIPTDAPPIPIHARHGQHSALYRYGTAFYVARYDLTDGKEFGPWTWRNNKWVNRGYGDGKPLYRAEELERHPGVQVLIVEGEKCADMGASALPFQVVISWCGGAKAVKGTDWSALYGRDVVIWPDADKAGRDAAADIVRELGGKASRVRVMNLPEETAEGWDIADAIGQGMDESELTDFMAKHLPGQAPAPVPEKSVAATSTDESAFVSWASLGLETNQGGLPYPTLANASKILQIHPKLKGKIWYDTFQRKLWHTLRNNVKCEWEDADAADLTVFIQQSMHLSKFNMPLIQEAARHAARRDSRNSLTDWLSSLKWDGVERLNTWVGDILGCDLTAYSMAVSRNWLISMVARAYVPGSQVDTMPVLEGYQGRGKSKFLEVLGGDWFGTVTTDIGELDFIQEIQGIWLVEIPDMTGFGRREHTQILSTITVRVDRYRPSYGRSIENRPRTCVLAATSETDDYLTDTRGRRRFWPLRCNDINLDGLHQQRNQLFAEAVARYREGATWHEMPEEADLEQLDRMQDDLWTEQVLSYADTIAPRMSGGVMKIMAVPAYVLLDVLKIDLADQTHKEKTRVAGILQRAGWHTSKHLGNRCWVKPIRKPKT